MKADFQSQWVLQFFSNTEKNRHVTLPWEENVLRIENQTSLKLVGRRKISRPVVKSYVLNSS